MTEVFHMACTRPMLFLKTDDINKATGKHVYKYIGPALKPLDEFERNHGYVIVPCGHCMDCRLSYSRQWADRCLLESMYHADNLFLTLTYDEFHVPMSAYGDPETGEAIDCMTLRKRDLQLFFKRLRKRFPDVTIRYYACGEYGDETFRPHFHVLLFGLDFPDRVVYKYSRGNTLYTSQILEEIWGNGFCPIGELTWETCAYVARYCTKKAVGFTSEVYNFFNIEPEFVVMSRKPGIAYQYYEDHKDEIFKFSSFSVSTPSGGRSLRPAKYYERLYESEFPGSLDDFRMAKRLSAERYQALKLKQTDLDFVSYLRVEEEQRLNSVKKLLRSDN